MKSAFDKVDFQEISIESIERIRNINKTEDGVFDISFNHIAHLKDGRCIEIDKSLCDSLGKDVLVVNINDGEEVIWVASNTTKTTRFERMFLFDSLFTLVVVFMPLYLLINLGSFIQQSKGDFLAIVGYILLSLFLCFAVYLRVHNDILIKAKTVHKIRSFKKKYRTEKEP